MGKTTISMPPNEATKALLQILGLDSSKVTEIGIYLKNGSPPMIEIKQLLEEHELGKVIAVIKKYKIQEDV